MCTYCGTKNYHKIYENHVGLIPKESNGRTYEIHHIDGNHDNNHPDNLIAVTLREHYDIHYSQGDYYACKLMKLQRMDYTPEEISILSSKAMLGKATVKDKDGNMFHVSIEDPRYLSGELVGIADGKAAIRNIITGETFMADKNDDTFKVYPYQRANKGQGIGGKKPGTSKALQGKKRPEHSVAVSGNKNGRHISTVFTWEHIKTGSKIQNTVYKMRLFTNCSPSSISNHLNGKSKSVSGWKLVR